MYPSLEIAFWMGSPNLREANPLDVFPLLSVVFNVNYLQFLHAFSISRGVTKASLGYHFLFMKFIRLATSVALKSG